MGENLGVEGYAAMLNQSGIAAIVESEDVVQVEDSVTATVLHGDEIKV